MQYARKTAVDGIEDDTRTSSEEEATADEEPSIDEQSQLESIRSNCFHYFNIHIQKSRVDYLMKSTCACTARG